MDTKNRRKGDRRAVKDLPARKTQDVKGGPGLSAKGGGEAIKA